MKRRLCAVASAVALVALASAASGPSTPAQRSVACLDLWRKAFESNPQLSELGVNLGKLLCGIGDADGARAVLRRVLTHDPDSPTA